VLTIKKEVTRNAAAQEKPVKLYPLRWAPGSLLYAMQLPLVLRNVLVQESLQISGVVVLWMMTAEERTTVERLCAIGKTSAAATIHAMGRNPRALTSPTLTSAAMIARDAGIIMGLQFA